MELFIGALLGGLVGGVVGGLIALSARYLRPWRTRVDELGRQALEREPVLVTIETDVDMIYAGTPDWIFGEYFLPHAPVEQPPLSRGAFRDWAIEQGGWDMESAVVMLTLVARSEATVVMRPPVIRVQSCSMPPTPGIRVGRPVGGASVTPLAFEAYLDGHPEMVRYVGTEEDREAGPLTWTFRQGDVHTVLIRAHASSAGVWRWRATVPLFVDGIARPLEVNHKDSDFILVGSETEVAATHSWLGNRWETR